jgi:hypothetical protein
VRSEQRRQRGQESAYELHFAFSRSVHPGGAESSLPPAQTNLDKHTV